LSPEGTNGALGVEVGGPQIRHLRTETEFGGREASSNIFQYFSINYP